jgi:hypothetical protein
MRIISFCSALFDIQVFEKVGFPVPFVGRRVSPHKVIMVTEDTVCDIEE